MFKVAYQCLYFLSQARRDTRNARKRNRSGIVERRASVDERVSLRERLWVFTPIVSLTIYTASTNIIQFSIPPSDLPDPETRAPFLYLLAVGSTLPQNSSGGAGRAERGWQKFVEYTRSLLDGARKLAEGNASIVSAKNRRICRYEDEDGSDVTSDDRILSWAQIVDYQTCPSNEKLRSSRMILYHLTRCASILCR